MLVAPQAGATMWKYYVINFQILSVNPRSFVKLGLVTLLGCSGASSTITSALANPLIAQASTPGITTTSPPNQPNLVQLQVSVPRNPNESFETMVRRSEAMARTFIQRSFDKNKVVTNVNLTVLGENQGFIAPIVSMKVNRQGWKRSPDPQMWATYFPNAQTLLGLQDNLVTAAQPASTPPVQTITSPAATPNSPLGYPDVPGVQNTTPVPSSGSNVQQVAPAAVPNNQTPGTNTNGSVAPNGTTNTTNTTPTNSPLVAPSSTSPTNNPLVSPSSTTNTTPQTSPPLPQQR
ncbi:MAG TPA: hypothetical protein V6D15_05055 [Oculatellaceae cyanobacterium]